PSTSFSEVLRGSGPRSSPVSRGAQYSRRHLVVNEPCQPFSAGLPSLFFQVFSRIWRKPRGTRPASGGYWTGNQLQARNAARADVADMVRASLEHEGPVGDFHSVDLYGPLIDLAIGLGGAGRESPLLQDVRDPQPLGPDRDRGGRQIGR